MSCQKGKKKMDERNGCLRSDRISFVPFKTSILRRVFARLPDEIKVITPIPDINIIGNEVREGWEKCIFID
jgi:hypothetical protein